MQWITCFLTDRTQSVKIGSSSSQLSLVTSGVPQGSVLGPTLFLLYINDLCDEFADLDIKSQLFADDLKLFAACKPSGFCPDLATALLRMCSCCDTWHMHLARSRTFWRRRFGATVLARSFWRRAVLERPFWRIDFVSNFNLLVYELILMTRDT